jgi:hypothetical protein
VVSGLARGTKSVVQSVFSAIAGIVSEPVKGTVEGGIKGGAKGLGKGMIGLVSKPVNGTLELVTLTKKGLTNTPKAVYVGLNKMAKREPPSGDSGSTSEDIFLGEQDGDVLFISKKQLNDSLMNGQTLSALWHASERQQEGAI